MMLDCIFPENDTCKTLVVELCRRFNLFTTTFFFFSVPRAGLFSVKIWKKFLAIKNFSVNETMSGQPNKQPHSLTFRELNG